MSGRNINNIIEIMKNDLKGAVKNPIVVVVLIAIIILPSLYALLNIQACWNPYENTDEIQIAIANLDKGSSYNDKDLNVGQEIVKDLKKNDKFDWTFITEEELRKGVHEGKYFAGIVIPKNFSKNIVSITTDDPHTAKLEYIVNIKANPVANKLTDSAVNAVYGEANAKIVQFIDVAAYGKLGELQSELASGSTQLSSGATQLSSGASQVSSGASEVSNGVDKVSSGADEVSDGAEKVTSGSKKVTSGSEKVSSGASKVSSGSEAVSSSAEKVSSASNKVQDSASQLESSVDPSSLPEGQVKQVVTGSLELANASSQVAGGSSEVAQGSVELAEGSTKLAKSSSKLADGSSSVAKGASSVADGASSLASGSEELAEGSLSLAAGSQLLANSAASALFTAASSLSGASGSLSDVTGIDESLIEDYFYAPVELDRHEEYPVSDYGSNVAPFYIVLSMWVGAVITCVMIKPGLSSNTKYSPLEMYVGKLGLFIIMSILQACVTIAGCSIMGVDMYNPPVFVFSAILISIIFMVIVYSLISSLGQVGKGISVILLVLQISGTGGIYPIEIMDPFFQVLYPYLPMTHAIILLRESLLGLLWSNYMPSLLYLVGLLIVTEILAIIIKEKAEKKAHYFEERLEETGLF